MRARRLLLPRPDSGVPCPTPTDAGGRLSCCSPVCSTNSGVCSPGWSPVTGFGSPTVSAHRDLSVGGGRPPTSPAAVSDQPKLEGPSTGGARTAAVSQDDGVFFAVRSSRAPRIRIATTNSSGSRRYASAAPSRTASIPRRRNRWRRCRRQVASPRTAHDFRSRAAPSPTSAGQYRHGWVPSTGPLSPSGRRGCRWKFHPASASTGHAPRVQGPHTGFVKSAKTGPGSSETALPAHPGRVARASQTWGVRMLKHHGCPAGTNLGDRTYFCADSKVRDCSLTFPPTGARRGKA